MMETEKYSSSEDIICKPQIIGFLKNWYTTNEIIVQGCDFKVSSSDEDSYSFECKSETEVVSQTETETVVVSKLYIREEDNPFKLDFYQKVIIKHYDSLENIKKEYYSDLEQFNSLKNLFITNYNYELIEESVEYDEFGFSYDQLENKRYRRVKLIKVFDDNLTISEIKQQVTDDVLVLEDNETDTMFHSVCRYFNCDDNLCIELKVYQNIK